MSLNGARLTWFGHATWLLETPGGKRVLIDPWFTGNPKTPTADPGAVDVMLLTHGHSDHTADVLRLAAEKKPEGGHRHARDDRLLRDARASRTASG